MPELTAAELTARILLAAFLGGAIGLEREFTDQPAGFRTHILVSLGAALFTLAGAFGVAAFEGVEGVQFDPTRIAAQVVTGIGFLGAGAIIQQGISVRGLTTAAALWVTAAIGLAVGLGFLAGAVLTTVVALIALVALKQLERVVMPRIKGNYIRLVVDVAPDFPIGTLTDVVERRAGHIAKIQVIESEGRTGGSRLIVELSLRLRSDVVVVVDELRRAEGVLNVDHSL